jgi:cobalt-zinc-cadmium efflux system membrane fusion protein
LKVIRYASVLVVIAAIATGFFWFSPQLKSWFGTGEEDVDSAHFAEASPSDERLEVTLAPEKLAAADIEIGRAEQRELAGNRKVPGQVEYDHNRHLELRSPANAVVQKILVDPGQQMRAGDALVLLRSSEIGLARDQVLSNQSELEIARKELSFREETATNLNDLLAALPDNPTIREIEQKFQSRMLGQYRETVLSAYSKLKLAEKVISNTSSLEGQGIIAGRLMDERGSVREIAAAAFQAAVEQARFDAAQQRDLAAAKVAQKERLLKISEQELATLLGPYSDHEPVMSDRALSEFTLHSPFDARVESRDISPAERVTPGQQLFVLANNDSLWVSAEIHERDWKLLEVEPGQEVTITSPALPGQEFTARVHHWGASVSPVTHAVPLVAELTNESRQFKPGMFVWVSIAHESVEPRTTIPTDAVVRNGGETFVFVPISGSMFRRVNVETGQETSNWVEITNGLAPGDAVVTKGAFFLKSELLLERED